MQFALVPAYNEEKTIEEVVRRLKKVGLKVIVIDDCSKDRTFELAKKTGAIVLKHEVNKGKGEAIKTGINFLLKRYPKVENVVVIDADMQYLPEEAINLLKPLKEKKADFIMGKRDWSKVPSRHKLGNFVWRSFFNFLFDQKLEDTNCGFVAFSNKAMDKIKDYLHGGYILESEMLVAAIRNNLKIGQVPVEVRYKKLAGIKKGVRMVLGVLIFIVKEGVKYKLSKLMDKLIK
ncbi:MAG: glycosyltransferase family 2 protein [Candidatus Aenigmatarchaeota archaeon]